MAACREFQYAKSVQKKLIYITPHSATPLSDTFLEKLTFTATI